MYPRSAYLPVPPYLSLILQHSLPPRTLASAQPSGVARVMEFNSDPGCCKAWTHTWPLAAAYPWCHLGRLPMSACFSLPSLLQFCLRPQHTDPSAARSLLFLHHIFAHYNGTYWFCVAKMFPVSLDYEDPGWPVGVFHHLGWVYR